MHWRGTPTETTSHEPEHVYEIETIDDIVIGLGSGWEVAPLPSLDFRWGHSLQIGSTYSSTKGVSCEDMEE